MYIENPFLVRSVWEFYAEQQIFPWASAASLQSQLIDLQENHALQTDCDALTFWTKMVTAANFHLLHKMALGILTTFGSAYSCESAFSQWRTSTTANSLINTCISVSTWPSHLLCQSSKSWQQTKGASSLIKPPLVGGCVNWVGDGEMGKWWFAAIIV